MNATLQQLLASFAMCSFTVGCVSYSPQDVSDPTELTIDKAMVQVGQGFLALKEELRKDGEDFKLGLYACQVQVVLNVTANASMGGSLVLDAAVKPPAAVVDAGLSAKASQENTSSASRGNTITIILENPNCQILKNIGPALAASKNENNLADTLERIKDYLEETAPYKKGPVPSER